jgi:hypothetical protein
MVIYKCSEKVFSSFKIDRVCSISPDFLVLVADSVYSQGESVD